MYILPVNNFTPQNNKKQNVSFQAYAINKETVDVLKKTNVEFKKLMSIDDVCSNRLIGYKPHKLGIWHLLSNDKIAKLKELAKNAYFKEGEVKKIMADSFAISNPTNISDNIDKHISDATTISNPADFIKALGQ